MVEVITSDKEVTFFAIVCWSVSMLTQKFSTSLTEIFLEVRCVTSKILFFDFGVGPDHDADTRFFL